MARRSFGVPLGEGRELFGKLPQSLKIVVAQDLGEVFLRKDGESGTDIAAFDGLQIRKADPPGVSSNASGFQ